MRRNGACVRVCVVNAEGKDVSKLQDAMKYACDRADCTRLSSGSSCGSLDEKGKASFAFSLYYQKQNQSDGACNFEGMAKVTTTAPSTGSCKFTVQFDSSLGLLLTLLHLTLLVPVTVSVASPLGFLAPFFEHLLLHFFSS